MSSPSEESGPGPSTDGDQSPSGWLFLRQGAVPERWRDRAVPVELVPLVPEETEQLLRGVEVDSRLEPDEERLAAFLAEGKSASEIARRLGITPRSVQRQLAKLRKRFGVSSTSELTALLGRRGF